MKKLLLLQRRIEKYKSYLEYYIFEYKEGKYLKGEDLYKMDQIDLLKMVLLIMVFQMALLLIEAG